MGAMASILAPPFGAHAEKEVGAKHSGQEYTDNAMVSAGFFKQLMPADLELEGTCVILQLCPLIGASMTLKLHPKQQNNGPNHGLSPGLEHKHECNQEDASDVGFSLVSAGKRCAKF